MAADTMAMFEQKLIEEMINSRAFRLDNKNSRQDL